MSIIQPDSIKTIAASVDVRKLSDEAAATLAPDVEYRLREVVQEALKFAKHAKRTKLTTDDINNALRLRNVEPVYGFGSRDPAKFLRVATHPELMYVRDPELSYNELIEQPLPKVPRDAGISAHWLAIEGVQPDVPENMPAEDEAPPTKRRQLLLMAPPSKGGSSGAAAAAARVAALQDAAAAAGMDPAALAAGGGGGADASAAAVAAAAAAGGAGARLQQGGAGVGVTPRGAALAAVQLQMPLRHTVSRELQVYFDKIAGLVLAPAAPGSAAAAAWPAALSGNSAGGAPPHQQHQHLTAAAADKQAALLRGACASLAVDPGLHPLVPYFAAFIADGVKQHLASLAVLDRLLQLTRALLANPGVHLAPYLAQLLPAVVTCAVTQSLGTSALEDHWALRREAASLLAAIAASFAAPHHNLQPRLCRVLAQAWLDGGKPLPTKYGAVVGLQALGPQVVRTLLIPNLEPFMTSDLLPAMQTPDSGGDAADARDGSSGGAGPLGEQQQQWRRLQQQQQQADAWQVYGALVSAVGAAMYDLLLGRVSGQLPLQLVLPRTAAAGGQGGGDWQQQYAHTLLAAKRAGGLKPSQHKDKKGQTQPESAGQQVVAAAAATKAGGGAQQQQQQHRQLAGPPALNGGPAAAAGGRGRQQQQQQQHSVAEVLAQSWREDSDVNATLGALLTLFGEDLLPCLPLPQVAAVTL